MTKYNTLSILGTGLVTFALRSEVMAKSLARLYLLRCPCTICFFETLEFMSTTSTILASFDAFDNEKLLSVVEMLKHGRGVDVPKYDFRSYKNNVSQRVVYNIA